MDGDGHDGGTEASGEQGQPDPRLDWTGQTDGNAPISGASLPGEPEPTPAPTPAPPAGFTAPPPGVPNYLPPTPPAPPAPTPPPEGPRGFASPPPPGGPTPPRSTPSAGTLYPPVNVARPPGIGSERAPLPDRSKSGGFAMYLLLLIGVAVLVGGFLYSRSRKDEDSASKDPTAATTSAGTGSTADSPLAPAMPAVADLDAIARPDANGGNGGNGELTWTPGPAKARVGAGGAADKCVDDDGLEQTYFQSFSLSSGGQQKGSVTVFLYRFDDDAAATGFVEGHHGSAVTSCLTNLYGNKPNLPFLVTEPPQIDGDRALQIRTRFTFGTGAPCGATTVSRWRAKGRYVAAAAVALCGTGVDQAPVAAAMDETLAKMQSLPPD